MTHWLQFIQLFNFELRYVPARSHQGPDALLRAPRDNLESEAQSLDDLIVEINNYHIGPNTTRGGNQSKVPGEPQSDAMFWEEGEDLFCLAHSLEEDGLEVIEEEDGQGDEEEDEEEEDDNNKRYFGRWGLLYEYLETSEDPEYITEVDQLWVKKNAPQFLVNKGRLFRRARIPTSWYCLIRSNRNKR